MARISIIKDSNSEERPQVIETNGFILLHLQGSKMEITGNISLRELVPIIMRATMSKFDDFTKKE